MRNEVLEETGLVVEVGRLVGVYTTPHRIIEYDDGSRIRQHAFSFEARPVGGPLVGSDETTKFGYLSFEE